MYRFHNCCFLDYPGYRLLLDSAERLPKTQIITTALPLTTTGHALARAGGRDGVKLGRNDAEGLGTSVEDANRRATWRITMLHFMKSQLYRRGWNKVTYQDLLQRHVLGRIVTGQIAIASAEHATRITFGLPPGIELTKEDEADMVTRHEESQQTLRAAESTVRKESSDPPKLSTWDGWRFHRRDGLPEVACWHDIAGQWFRQPGILACVYPYLPQHLCERLVSLDGEPQEGGKEEWIEYTSIPLQGDEGRRFVRVDLVIETNTSITVELLESRVIHGEATAWWRHWKV